MPYFTYGWFSVTKSCPMHLNSMHCRTPGISVLHYLPELLKLMSIESVMPSNHLILCHTLLLQPSIFPSIRVFSSELTLQLKWPKEWSFSFNNSPSSKYSGLISLGIDSFDLLEVPGVLKSLQHNLKASVLHLLLYNKSQCLFSL